MSGRTRKIGVRWVAGAKRVYRYRRALFLRQISSLGVSPTGASAEPRTARAISRARSLDDHRLSASGHAGHWVAVIGCPWPALRALAAPAGPTRPAAPAGPTRPAGPAGPVAPMGPAGPAG